MHGKITEDIMVMYLFYFAASSQMPGPVRQGAIGLYGDYFSPLRMNESLPALCKQKVK